MLNALQISDLEKIKLMRTIKQVIEPLDIMNRGKVLMQ
jgi:hypothetical protein